MNETTQSYVELHIAVFLYGLTAILGDLISLNAVHLVWWRILFTMLSLFLLRNIFKIFRKMPRTKLLQYAGIGWIVGLHWLLFYGAIKLSNASITLVCLATATLFTAFLEPMILKGKIKKIEIALGFLMIPGMYFIVNGIKAEFIWGLPVALTAAFAASLFGVLNKKMMSAQANPIDITTVEISSSFVLLTLLIPFSLDWNNLRFLPQGMDWVYLLVLSLLCTTLAFILTMRSLRHLSAFITSLSINLEPVYGILLAYFILDDASELNKDFYIGVCIIIAAVLIYPIIEKSKKRTERRKKRRMLVR